MRKSLWVMFVLAAACSAYAVDDIKLDLALKGSSFEVGEAVGFDLTFTNTTERDAVIYVDNRAAGMPLDCRLEVLDESGKPVSAYFGASSKTGTPVSIAAGKTAVISDVANRWAVVASPGKYSARAVWSPRVSPWPPYTLLPPTDDAAKVESPSVAFTVVGATQEGLDRRLSDARDKLKAAKTRDEKAAAVCSLGLTLDPRAVPELVKVSRQPEIAAEVEAAFARFAKIESASELGASMADALVSDLEKNGPSETFALLLARFNPPAGKIVPALVVWVKDGKERQRADALLSLSVLDKAALKPELKPVALSSLEDNAPLVRRCALLVLGSAQFDGTINAVIRRAKVDKEPLVRSQAALTLARFSDEHVIDTLTDMLKDSSEEVVKSAVSALAYTGGPKARALLVQFAESRSGYLKEIAISAIRQMK